MAVERPEKPPLNTANVDTANVDTADAEATGELARRLVDFIRPQRGAVVAFSGGVDSAVVAAAAHRAIGDRALAVTSTSPSVPENQREWARIAAGEIGIRHRFVSTPEIERPEYRTNDARRCFWCKQTLYESLAMVADSEGFDWILSGTNADDLGDYRPGIEAGRRAGVITPLADLGIDKRRVRQLAREWNLSVWNLPAAPCLASRIAYGVPVTAERLRKIERAEAWLRQRGYDELRVRLHAGELARIEVPADQIARLAAPELSTNMVTEFQSLGFRYVTLDLVGLRSGSLNQLIQIEPAQT